MGRVLWKTTASLFWGFRHITLQGIGEGVKKPFYRTRPDCKINFSTPKSLRIRWIPPPPRLLHTRRNFFGGLLSRFWVYWLGAYPSFAGNSWLDRFRKKVFDALPRFYSENAILHNNLETLPNFSPVCPHCRFMLKTNICLLKQLRTQSNHNSNFHFLSRLHKYSFQFQTCNFPVGCFQFVCCRLQLTFATYLALAFLLAASQVLHLPHILLLTRLQNIFLCIFLIFCFLMHLQNIWF